MDFCVQVDVIKKLIEQYNVIYIGIDLIGVGYGVYENVKVFFFVVWEFVYNFNVKNVLVFKVYDIISYCCLEFDVGYIDIVQLFMVICCVIIVSGNCLIYEVSCSEEVSYVDLVWVIMYVLFNELLQGEFVNISNIVEIF